MARAFFAPISSCSSISSGRAMNVSYFARIGAISRSITSCRRFLASPQASPARSSARNAARSSVVANASNSVTRCAPSGSLGSPGSLESVTTRAIAAARPLAPPSNSGIVLS